MPIWSEGIKEIEMQEKEDEQTIIVKDKDHFIDEASRDQFGGKVKLPGGNVAKRMLPVRIRNLDAKIEERQDKNPITRRTFVKGIAGAAVCCACFSLDSLAASEEREENINEDGMGKEHLAAVCGTYCGACPAYIAKHSGDEQIKMRLEKRISAVPMKALKTIPDPGWMDGILCDGCLSGGQIAFHCQRCAIKICAANKQNVTRCSDCKELPCYRITNMINTGLLHRAEYLPNLEKIRVMGVQEWVIYEEERWRCPRCGLPLSWYDTECAGCGEPRSEQLFPLT